MIDWFEPIRLKKSKTQLYVVGRNGTARQLGTKDRWGSGGMWYDEDGDPLHESPWGAIENFDPLADLGVDSWREVPTPSQRRAGREMAQANEDNPLFGVWS